MTSAATTSSPSPAAPLPAGYEECAREPIHIPSRIQPHGLLLAVTEPDLIIRNLSLNVATLLNLPPERIVGRPLSDFLPHEPVSRVLEGLTRHESARPLFAGVVTFRDKAYSLLVHRTTLGNQPHVALEFEPATPASEGTLAFQNLYTIVSTSASTLQETTSAADACALTAREVRRLTGFDRVMIYRFDADWNGQVVAEEKYPDAAVASYLDLWFPATDIPPQARDLYLRNPSRLIADVDYTPVDLFPTSPANAPYAALDMSQCTLRSVSPVHVQYLKNMNVGSSMSVSIIAQGKLWGLIACHHRTPRFIPFELRTACELLAQVLALKLASKEAAQSAERRLQLNAIQSRLLAAMAREDNFLTGLTKKSADLLQFADASGVALLFQSKCTLLGSTPTEEQVRTLIDHLAARHRQEILASDQLTRIYPPAEEFAATTAGILALSISRVHRSYIVWFRPEVIQTVSWSGHVPDRPPAQGDPIHPRKSFEQWKQTVRGRTLPWQESVLAAAADFRAAVVSIVLRTAEEMALLAEELQRSNRELELFSYSVSHDLRAPFRHIQGFAELLRYHLGDTPDAVTKSHLDTISKSAEHAGALVDALLALSQLGRTDLRRLHLDMRALALEAVRSLDEDTASRRLPAGRITWDVGELPNANADPMLIRTVWRNLISNAAKYSGKHPAPHITIGATPGTAETTYFVKDNGAGFDMRYVHKLFGVFQRLHLSEEYEGTGIGLANVRRIVERHGGRVWAEGVPNQGATFYFSLPHTKEEEPQETDHG